MRITLLGPIEVHGEEAALTRRDRVVAGALCVVGGEPLTNDQLALAVWGDEPPKSSAKVIQGSVMRLRRALGIEAIETTTSGYRLVLDGDSIDTHAFEHLVDRARGLAMVHEPERAAATYVQALALWRGSPLPELQEWDPARAETARLVEVRRSVEEELVEARMDAGRTAEAVADARNLVAREPFREHRWALLALALYRSGRQREALDAIRRARTTLLDELGLDPGPELTDLEQRILQQDPALLHVPDAPAAVSTACPWPGLRPFDAEQAEFFVGREDVVATCLARLAEFPLLVVVGASGSGKSSLVRAGIVPALRDGGARVTVLTPGAAPVAALSHVLSSGDDVDVLVVDQLEELFSNPAAADVSTVLARLTELAESGRRLVVTLRADHLAALSANPSFARLAERGLLLLTPMTETELRLAIEEPARRAGLVLEPGLVDLLVRDVLGEAGGLPLMSHALAETWARRDGKVLTVEGYTRTGGIRGAVAQSAERLYDSLSTADRHALRGVLHRLVTPTPSGEPVAARVPTRVFAATPDAPRVLDLLVRARLVTTSADTATVAHESLVRAWPRLRTWLDEDVEGQRILQHLQVAADGWESAGRSVDELYRGARLRTALEWRDRSHPLLAANESEFLIASEDHELAQEKLRERELDAQRRRNRQLRYSLAGVAALLVLALAAGSLAALSNRDARAAVARAELSARDAEAARLGQSALAEPQADLSLLEAREAVALSDTPATEGSLLAVLARQTGLLRTVPTSVGGENGTLDFPVNEAGTRVLLSTIDANKISVYLLDTSTGQPVSGSPVVSGAPSGEEGFPVGFVDRGRVAVVATRPSPDSPVLQTQELSADDGHPLGAPRTIPGLTAPDRNTDTGYPRISTDGSTLAALIDRTVLVWRREGAGWSRPRTVALPPLPPAAFDAVQQILLSADGTRLAFLVKLVLPPAPLPTYAAVLDTGSMAFLTPLVGPRGNDRGPNVVALSPDGRSWAFADRSGTIEVRAVDTARPATRIAGTTPVTALGWSADGRSLASGDTAGGLVVTGLSPVRAIDRFAGRNHEVRLVALPGQTGQLVSLDNTTTLSADSLSRNDFMSSVPSRPAIAVATAQSGAVMAVGEAGGWVSIRDATTLEERRRFWLGPYPGAPDDAMTSELRRVTALAVTPDGSVVVAADRSGHLRAWSTADGTVTWSADDVPVSYLDISRDGTMLATSGAHAASGDPQTDPDVQSVATTFTLWDLRSHRQLFTDDLRDLVTPWSPTNSPTPVDVTFSPDGTTVALGFYGTFNGVIVYDAASHRRVLTRSSATDASFHGVAALMFSADSSTLLVREPSDEITGFRLPGGDVTTRLSTSTGREADLALADGGRWLVGTTTSSLDVWDGATGQLALSGLRLSSDGALRRLPVVATSDAHILVGTSTRVLRLDMDPARWAALACTLAGRSMTQAEWARYLPGRPYAPACQPASGAPGRAVIPG